MFDQENENQHRSKMFRCNPKSTLIVWGAVCKIIAELSYSLYVRIGNQIFRLKILAFVILLLIFVHQHVRQWAGVCGNEYTHVQKWALMSEGVCGRAQKCEQKWTGEWQKPTFVSHSPIAHLDFFLTSKSSSSVYRNDGSVYQNLWSVCQNLCSLHKNSNSLYQNSLLLYQNACSLYHNSVVLYIRL